MYLAVLVGTGAAFIIGFIIGLYVSEYRFSEAKRNFIRSQAKE